MKCPYCGEGIQDGAAKCRYCREWINPTPNHEPALAQGGSVDVEKAGWDASQSEDSPISAVPNRIPKSPGVDTGKSSAADRVRSATVPNRSAFVSWRAGYLTAWLCFGGVAASVAAIQRGPEAAMVQAMVFGCWAGVFALLVAFGNFAYRFLPPRGKSPNARFVIYLAIAGLTGSFAWFLQPYADRGPGVAPSSDSSPEPFKADTSRPERETRVDAFLTAVENMNARSDDAVKDWYLYKSPDGDFEVKLPEEPEITQRPGTLMLHSQGRLGKAGILRKENPLGTAPTSLQLSDGLRSNLRSGGYNILEAHNTEDFSFVTASNGELRMEIKALSTPSFVYQLIITEPASQPTERFQDQRRGCFGSLKVHL